MGSEVYQIAGQSAGGRSVTLHLLSPMSKGLFHKAIALSGSMANQLVIPEDHLDLTKIQAEISKCPTENIAKMLECLKKVTYIFF
jgi:carboxylesterase type B